MSAILALFLQNPIVLAIGGGVIAAAVAWMRGRLSGAKLERQKQAAAETKARDIADVVDNDIGALPPDAARERLKEWSR